MRQLREKWKLNTAPVRTGESGKNKAPGLQFHSTLNRKKIYRYRRISKTLRKDEFFKLDPPKRKFIQRCHKKTNWKQILGIQN